MKRYVPRHKYNAVRTKANNINFSSKKEAMYYEQLKLRQKAGEVIFFLRQVPFDLPGGITYRVDFQEFLADGTVRFVDVKGFKTKEFIMKKKIVESIYPVRIEIV